MPYPRPACFLGVLAAVALLGGLRFVQPHRKLWASTSSGAVLSVSFGMLIAVRPLGAMRGNFPSASSVRGIGVVFRQPADTRPEYSPGRGRMLTVRATALTL